jgi:hypothetical protein
LIFVQQSHCPSVSPSRVSALRGSPDGMCV